MSKLTDILDDLEDAISVIDGTGNYTYNLGKNIQFDMDTPDVEGQDQNDLDPKILVNINDIEIDDWATNDFEVVAEIKITGYVYNEIPWTGDKTEYKKILNLQRDIQSAVYQFFDRQRTVDGTEVFTREGSIRFLTAKADNIMHVHCEFNIRFDETES